MTTPRPKAASGRSARVWLRGFLAGPLTFLTSWLLMAGAALYLPKGSAGIDNIVFPVLLFPLIWCVLLLYALRDDRLLRAYGVISLLSAGHLVVILRHLLNGAGT